jgi:hypothetical protein
MAGIPRTTAAHEVLQHWNAEPEQPRQQCRGKVTTLRCTLRGFLVHPAGQHINSSLDSQPFFPSMENFLKPYPQFQKVTLLSVLYFLLPHSSLPLFLDLKRNCV